MPRRKPFNPFYALLVVVGVAFSVTACAYGVTAMRALQPPRPGVDTPPQSTSLVKFMDEHGNRLLIGELLLLALTTVGAISTDGYWQRRTDAERLAETEDSATDEENQA